MTSVRVFQVDAFTAQPGLGNRAAVVLDAERLSEDAQRRLTQALGSLDTAFVLPPDGPDHDLRVRFLTPRGEAPFIGHATLAVHAVRAGLGLPPGPRQKQSGGLVRIDVLQSASPARIAIHQPAPEMRGPVPPALREELLSSLGIDPSQLDSRLAPVLAGTRGTRVLLAVRDGALLAGLRPDLARLAALAEPLGAPGTLVFTLQPRIRDVFSEARMFCPALGFPEDPVSGYAHGLLGAYLLREGILSARTAPPDTPGIIEFTGAQGHHIGRAGRVTVALALEGSTLTSVSLIGEAVIASESLLSI